MDTQQLAARLEDELVASASRIETLLADRARMIESADTANVDDEHDPEGATLAFEREQLTALILQAERTRQDIGDALDRLRDGTYGTCEVCEQPIAVERLEARPWVRTCVTCAGR